MEKTEEKIIKKKKKGWILVWIVAVLLVVVISTVVMLVLSKSGNRKLQEQLDLGEKYISELNYEQAIVAYESAIEIEPMSVEAYLGLAEVYVAQGDYEKAISVLEEGYQYTTSDLILQKIKAIDENALNQEADNNGEEVGVENYTLEQLAEMEYFESERLYHLCAGSTSVSNLGFYNALSYTERRKVMEPYLTSLLSYLENENNHKSTYNRLHSIYLFLGDLENAKKYNNFPTEPIDQGDGYFSMYDEYGRYIGYCDEDGNWVVHYVYEDDYTELHDVNLYTIVYEYDDGRILRNGTIYYEYDDNKREVVTYTYFEEGNPESKYIISIGKYDEFGRIVYSESYYQNTVDRYTITEYDDVNFTTTSKTYNAEGEFLY